MTKKIRNILFALVFTFSLTTSSLAEENSNVETNFIAMLKNATLKGTWAPVQQAQIGAAKGDDSYRVSRVVKKEGDNWLVYSLFTYQGKEIEFPIPAVVKFAGDTAVLILDNVRAGQGAANWSARVLFHDNVYAGRWWETSNKEHAGTVAGTITQAK
jgi:hypothetical protein